MLEKLKTIIAQYIKSGADEITEKTELRGDLGLISLDLVNIAVAIEDEFNVEIPDRQVSMLKTVGDVIAYLEKSK